MKTTMHGTFTKGCFLLGSLFLAFGQGHYPNGMLAVAGIILWIRFFREANPWLSVPLFTVANLLIWEWAYLGMVPLPMAARIGMFGAISFTFAMLFLADRWINRRMKSLVSSLMLPSGWVAFDFFSSRFSPGGTWASISYAFAENATIIQLASVAGWTGITFFIVWFAAAINWLIDQWLVNGKIHRFGVSSVSLAVGLVFAFGIYRLNSGQTEPPVRVACVVAPNTFVDEYVNDLWAYTRGIKVAETSSERAIERIEQSKLEHFAMVEKAVKFDPKFIVWPEANAVMTTEEEASWIEQAKEIATSHQVFLGMGLVVFRPGTGLGTLNKFVLVDPNGNIAMDTLKATRVPGSLNAKSNGVLPVIESSVGRLSAAICFDMDFPQLISQAGVEAIDLFFAPSNDWQEVRSIHAQMAKMRSIEQGFALVRPTKDGITLVTDSTGRTVASMLAADNQTAVMVADVPVGRRATIYSMIGDVLCYLCIVVFCLLVMIGFGNRKISGSPDAP